MINSVWRWRNWRKRIPTFKVNFDEETGQTSNTRYGWVAPRNHCGSSETRVQNWSKSGCTWRWLYKEAFTKRLNTARFTRNKQAVAVNSPTFSFEIGPADERPYRTAIYQRHFRRIYPPWIYSFCRKGFKEATFTECARRLSMTTLKWDCSTVRSRSELWCLLSFEMAFCQSPSAMPVKMQGRKLLEPIMKLEVITPEDHMGDVIGDLNRRRGMIEGFDNKNNATVIKAKVPAERNVWLRNPVAHHRFRPRHVDPRIFTLLHRHRTTLLKKWSLNQKEK